MSDAGVYMFQKAGKLISDINFKLKRKKKFISCKWLEHGIIFDHAKIIRVCCEQSHPGKGRYVLEDNFNGLWLDIDKVINEKKQLRNMIRTGHIPDCCIGCSFLKEDYWDDEDYFDEILLTHWTKCNAQCIYCPAVKDENLLDSQHYNIIPILSQLFDKGLISKKAKFSIAGGESTLYPEFEKLLYFLTDSGITNININSSGIRYSAAISDLISRNLAEIVISIDSSDAFIYNLIKNVDFFDVVIDNIKRYLKYEQISEERVIVKFILINSINDSITDVLHWFILCNSLGVKKLALDVDIDWYNKMRNDVPEYLKEIILFAKKIAEINNVHLDLYDRADMIYKSINKK